MTAVLTVAPAAGRSSVRQPAGPRHAATPGTGLGELAAELLALLQRIAALPLWLAAVPVLGLVELAVHLWLLAADAVRRVRARGELPDLIGTAMIVSALLTLVVGIVVRALWLTSGGV